MTHFSALMQDLLGLNTDHKPKRIRTINLGENLTICTISGNWKEFIQTLGGHMIIVPISPMCAFVDARITQSTPVPSTLVMSFNLYGKDKNGNLEKICKLIQLTTNTTNIWKFRRLDLMGKTLYEIAKKNNYNNWLAHKNDVEWYFGFECDTVQPGSDQSEIFVAQITYKSSISTMPAEVIGV